MPLSTEGAILILVFENLGEPCYEVYVCRFITPLPHLNYSQSEHELVNTRSICGPPGKTDDFLDYAIGSHLDICIVTETFLTEHNNVTRATLHPQGYSFDDQPRINGDPRGGIGIFHKNSFKVEKVDFGEKSSFEFSEWNITWQNCVDYQVY